MADQAKRFRRIRMFQRYVLNPPMNLMVWAGLSPHHILIETTGRKSGKRRINVVGVQAEGTTLWVVAEHGRRAGYIANITAEPKIKAAGSARRPPSPAG